MKRKEILNTLQSHREDIAAFDVKSLALFGSIARDEARAGSDVDLLVEFSRPVGLFQFIALKQYLEDLLNCPVDLGTLRSLKSDMKERVLEEAIYVT